MISSLCRAANSLTFMRAQVIEPFKVSVWAIGDQNKKGKSHQSVPTAVMKRYFYHLQKSKVSPL